MSGAFLIDPLTSLTPNQQRGGVSSANKHRGVVSGLKVGFMGDSITANALVSGGGIDQSLTIGYPAWVIALAKGALRCSDLFANMFATSGYSTQDMITNHLNNAVAANLDVIIICAGSNDFATGAGIAYTTTINNLLTICRRFESIGTTVVLVTVPPRITTYDDSSWKKRAQVNRWIMEEAPLLVEGLLPVDLNPYVTDMTNPDGNPIANFLKVDNVHPTATGSYYIAREILRPLTPHLHQVYHSLNTQRDVYDATNCPNGNLLTNGLLNGTGGTRSHANFTGNLADSWTFENITASGSIGTLAVACSKVARTDGKQGVWQQFVFSGTPTANFYTRFRPTTSPSAGFSPGDSVICECEAEFDTGAANMTNVTLQLANNGGTLYTMRTLHGAPGDTDYNLPSTGDTVRMLLRSVKPYVIPASTTSLVPEISFRSTTGVASVLTARIANFVMRRV